MTGIQRGLAAGDEQGYPGYIKAAYGRDRSWKVQGLCTGEDNFTTEDTEAWWWLTGPGDRRDGKSGKAWISKAEALCALCPVQHACLKWAFEVEEYFTWALSEAKRTEMIGWYTNEPRGEKQARARLSALVDVARETGTPVLLMYNRMAESQHAKRDQRADLERSTA